MKRLRWAVFFVPVVLTACAGVAPLSPVGTSATAEVRDANDRVVGQATLTEVIGGVRIVLEARGLPPGEKGVHVHAVGKCEPPAFASAGGHFNPLGKQHGLLNPTGPHAGDLPNITIAAEGTGRFETLTERVTLGAGTNSLFGGDGTALVVHGAPDDFKTDPTGNSGARIACGVIVKPPSKP
jgi:Cu-Zn family superoxide dismutase